MGTGKIKEFDGIYVRAGAYCINTLSGHFAKLAPGCDTIKDSLDHHLNNSKHSIHERYYGQLSVMQSAVITALAKHRDEGLSLTEIADIVYDAEHMPENPAGAIGNVIDRIKGNVSVLPWTANIIGSQDGKVHLAPDPTDNL